MLQYVAVCCSMLQCIAIMILFQLLTLFLSLSTVVLQSPVVRVAEYCRNDPVSFTVDGRAPLVCGEGCSVLQYVAVYCNNNSVSFTVDGCAPLVCGEGCSKLQYVAVYCNNNSISVCFIVLQ